MGSLTNRVLSTVAITSYFNFMNRLADSLGVEIPEGRQEIMADWLSPGAKQAPALAAECGRNSRAVSRLIPKRQTTRRLL